MFFVVLFQDEFPLLFFGQSVVAVAQIFILGMPSQLAATWFPANQVSSACAIGVFGNQVNGKSQLYKITNLQA
jgi:hypothetical protein